MMRAAVAQIVPRRMDMMCTSGFSYGSFYTRAAEVAGRLGFGGTFLRCAPHLGGGPFFQLFGVPWLAKPQTLDRRLDPAEQTCEHGSGADFDRAADALACQIAHRVHPVDRIGNLLIQAFPGFRAGRDLARLPIVHEGAGEIAK